VDRSTLWTSANHIALAYTCRMKNPFRKDPTHNLETTVASLTTRGEQLAVKRATAQLALDRAIKARQHALLSGDLDDQRALNNLQGLVDTAASTLTGIDDALTVLAHDKAEAEHQIKAEHERKQRADAADKLHKQVAAIEAALPIYLQTSRDLADGLSQIGWHFELRQMTSFIQSTMGQIEVAANFALAELKSMQEAIRGGQQPVPQDPFSMPSVEPLPEPPVMTVFMLRSGNFATKTAASSLPANLRMQRCRCRPHSARCAKVSRSRPPTRIVRSSVVLAAVTSIRTRLMSSISMSRSRTASCSMLTPFSVPRTSRKSTAALKRARSRSRFRACDHA
jgi:multidrug efflux pump subunit AcrA (membrane-fusion protein)